MPLFAGIYNFGWRVLICAFVAILASWLTEYAFTSREGKPVSTAGLVTGLILSLILPPNVPFWQIIVGCVFSIVFGKMVFGGFGRNVFNPAMVGRCFLYICFPATIAASWYVPHTEGLAGFLNYSTLKRVASADQMATNIDGVTSATTFSAVKKLNANARNLKNHGEFTKFQAQLDFFEKISLKNLFIGNINGSTGETSSLLILFALVFLIYQNVAAISLVLSPLIGIFLAGLFTHGIGIDVLPVSKLLLVNYFAGGTMFAVVFMTTEPISAPGNSKARWLYGITIGFLGGVIRSMSAFNGGLMFAILLGNMFGPLIETGCTSLEQPKKDRPE